MTFYEPFLFLFVLLFPGKVLQIETDLCCNKQCLFDFLCFEKEGILTDQISIYWYWRDDE